MPSLQKKLLVIGSYNQDLSWRTLNFPRPGETVIGAFQMGPGGKGSNQAVAAARAGAATTFIGAIGKDPFGEAAHTFLKSEGLALYLREKTEAATGTAAIMVNSEGQNEIIVALGSNLLLANSDIPDTILQSAGVVVCQLESNVETTGHILKRAKTAGALTILNPAPMPHQLPLGMLKYTDIIVPNEGEFAQLLSQVEPGLNATSILADIQHLPREALHQACRSLGVFHVIITLGENGAFVSSPDKYISLPALPVTVIDTTGAGDAFIGGLAAYLAENPGAIFKAAAFANCAAALAVTQKGAATACPFRSEIDALFAKHANEVAI